MVLISCLGRPLLMVCPDLRDYPEISFALFPHFWFALVEPIFGIPLYKDLNDHDTMDMTNILHLLDLYNSFPNKLDCKFWLFEFSCIFFSAKSYLHCLIHNPITQNIFLICLYGRGQLTLR